MAPPEDIAKHIIKEQKENIDILEKWLYQALQIVDDEVCSYDMWGTEDCTLSKDIKKWYQEKLDQELLIEKTKIQAALAKLTDEEKELLCL